MSTALTNPLYTLPFSAPIANALRSEYLAMPWRRRWQARRKAALRRLAMRFSGQGALLCDAVPPRTRHVLLIYSWTTVGDAIMDLSARRLVPSDVRLDLCIASHLAPLFVDDGTFGSVVTDLDGYEGAPDFILLDCLTSALLRDKARYFPGVRFTSLRGELIGERFDRTAFADRRMRQLFGQPPGPVAPPRLSVAGSGVAGGMQPFRLAVAIGARCADRRYPFWAQVLACVDERWPRQWPTAEFWLLGSDNGVDELSLFDPSFLHDRCVVKVGAGTLRQTAGWLAGCDAFVGVDGGLMHLAIALGRPGLALFTQGDPDHRVPRAGRMQVLHRHGPAAAVHPVELANRILAAMPTPASRAGQLCRQTAPK